MEGKRGNDLQALTEIADNDVLIVDTGEGTRKITYGALCAAVKNTLGIREVVESTNITEPGFLMDGKTASEAFAELYSKFGYSFEETCIGTWVDGKPLYRKMIDFGTLPSNGEKMQQVDVDNLEFCYIDVGNSLWMDSKWNIFNAKTAPGIFTPIYTTMISTMYYSQKSVYVNTTVASASLYRMYVCIKYTKTTD